LVGNPEGKRPQGRPRRRWADNIKRDLECMRGRPSRPLHRDLVV
jgi:hypothetical protein